MKLDEIDVNSHKNDINNISGANIVQSNTLPAQSKETLKQSNFNGYEMLVDYIKQPTTSPTINDIEKEKVKEDRKIDEEARESAAKFTPGATEVKERTTVKDIMDDEETAYVSEVIIEVVDSVIDFAADKMGYIIDPLSKTKQQRVSKALSKAIKTLDFEISEWHYLIIVSIIVYTGKFRTARKKEIKRVTNEETEVKPSIKSEKEEGEEITAKNLKSKDEIKTININDVPDVKHKTGGAADII